jgi:hypothetical protein
MPDPHADPDFRWLKARALAGSDKGPEFDHAVLSIVAEIEVKGEFDVDEDLYDPLTLQPNPRRADAYSDGLRFAGVAFRQYARGAKQHPAPTVTPRPGT